MGAFAAVRAYAIRPYICTVYSLGIRSLLVSFRFSPTIVGCIAYALHVSEDEMIAVNKASSFNGRVRRFEGVCDTPLHIYAQFVGHVVSMLTRCQSLKRFREKLQPMLRLFLLASPAKIPTSKRWVATE